MPSTLPDTRTNRSQKRARPCVCSVHKGLYAPVPHNTAWRCEKRNGKIDDAPRRTKISQIDVDCDDSVSVDSDSTCASGSDASVQVDDVVGNDNSSDDSVQVDDSSSGDDSDEIVDMLDEVNRGSSGDDSDVDSDSTSSDSEVESTSTTAYQELRVKQYARELVELVNQGTIDNAGLERVLKIFHSLVEDLFGTGATKDLPVDIPKTLHMAYKYAELDNMDSVLLDICPNNDHYVFPGDASSYIQLPGAPARDLDANKEEKKQVQCRATHCPIKGTN